MTILLTSKKC